MKMLRSLQLTKYIAAAALAGLSLSAAYAAPGAYTPDAASPLNGPNTGINIETYLALIDAQLPGTQTLVIPAVNAPGIAPLKADFTAAIVAAANAAASDADKAAIVRAGLLLGANPALNFAVQKDVVNGVLSHYLASVGYSEAGATAIVQAAISANPAKGADAMTGAFMALSAVGSESQETDAGGIAAGGLATENELNENVSSKEAGLAEKLAEAAVKNAKGFGTPNFEAEILNLTTELIGSAVTSGANAVIDDIAKGISKAASAYALAGSITSLQPVAQAIAAATPADAVSQAQAILGALRAFKPDDATRMTDVLTGFNVGSATDASNTAAQGAYVQIGTNKPTAAAETVTLVTADTANAAYIIMGSGAASGSTLPQALQDSLGVAGLSLATKQAMAAGATRTLPAYAGKLAGAAVTGGLTAAQALSSVLPNTFALYAKDAAAGAMKANLTNTNVDSAAALTAAIQALHGTPAGQPEDNPAAGIIDAANAIMKARKAHVTDLVAAAITALPNGSGYREAAIIGLVKEDSKNSALPAAAASAAGTAGASLDEQASILAAATAAQYAKNNSKAQVTYAQDKIRNEPTTSVIGIVQGVSFVNPKLAAALMGNALHNHSLSVAQKTALLNAAKAVNKKLEIDMQAAFDTAEEIIADPGNAELVDIVDKRLLANPGREVAVTQAAAAAAPAYAHYTARAAGFRGKKNIGKLPAALIQGADMGANTTNDPAALAALMAGFVSGIIDAKHSVTDRDKQLTAAVGSFVKEALGKNRTTADFRGVNPTTGAAPTAPNQPTYGSAGAVTGLVSALSASNAGSLTAGDRLHVALIAAGKAGKKEIAVIAQAAAQAAAFIYGLTGGTAASYNTAGIISALVTGSGASSAIITAAANAGRAEAAAGNFGAGAAGVANYAHFNTNNSPITDISGF